MSDYEKSLTLVRSTGLGHIARSPAHFKHYVETPEKETDDMAFGQAFHCYVLMPDAFDGRYIVRPDFGDMRYKENKAEYTAWKSEAGEREEVDARDMAHLEGMAQAIRNHRVASRLLVGGYAEQQLRQPRGDLTQVAQPDYVLPTKGVLVDLKKCQGALPREVEKSVANYGYLMQAAHYLGVAAEHGMADGKFVFLFVEDKPPYGILCGDLEPEDVTMMETRRQELMDLQQRCVETNTWPGYDDRIQRIKLPSWARY